MIGLESSRPIMTQGPRTRCSVLLSLQVRDSHRHSSVTWVKSRTGALSSSSTQQRLMSASFAGRPGSTTNGMRTRSSILARLLMRTQFLSTPRIWRMAPVTQRQPAMWLLTGSMSIVWEASVKVIRSVPSSDVASSVGIQRLPDMLGLHTTLIGVSLIRRTWVRSSMISHLVAR